MNFITKTEWEVARDYVLGLEEGEKVYHCVEARSFQRIFIIDYVDLVLAEDEDATCMKRLIIMEPINLLSTLNQLDNSLNQVEAITLFQGPNFEPDDAMSSIVVDAIYGCDKGGNFGGIIFKLKNKETVIDSAWAEKEEELIAKDYLIKDGKLTSFARNYVHDFWAF